MSQIIQIADAVVEELNGSEFSLGFTAVRHYLPAYELQEMQSLHVTVVPKGVVVATLDRTRCQNDVQIDIAVQKKLVAMSLEEIDPLMKLVQEIADFFKQRRLTAYPEAMWLKTENKPIYAPEHLQNLRQFTSLLTLTFRTIR